MKLDFLSVHDAQQVVLSLHQKRQPKMLQVPMITENLSHKTMWS